MKGYTMPFLWIANNDYEAIGREIEKIHESGSETFCVESRTHSDFCRPQWWEVMDFIVKKADSLSMRVWLLDDKHYPTGFANGAVERFPELRQRHIFSENRDLCGPASGRLIIRSVAGQGAGCPPRMRSSAAKEGARMGISSRHYFPSGRGISPPVFAGRIFPRLFCLGGDGV